MPWGGNMRKITAIILMAFLVSFLYCKQEDSAVRGFNLKISQYRDHNFLIGSNMTFLLKGFPSIEDATIEGRKKIQEEILHLIKDEFEFRFFCNQKQINYIEVIKDNILIDNDSNGFQIPIRIPFNNELLENQVHIQIIHNNRSYLYEEIEIGGREPSQAISYELSNQVQTPKGLCYIDVFGINLGGIYAVFEAPGSSGVTAGRIEILEKSQDRIKLKIEFGPNEREGIHKLKLRSFYRAITGFNRTNDDKLFLDFENEIPLDFRKNVSGFSIPKNEFFLAEISNKDVEIEGYLYVPNNFEIQSGRIYAQDYTIELDSSNFHLENNNENDGNSYRRYRVSFCVPQGLYIRDGLYQVSIDVFANGRAIRGQGASLRVLSNPNVSLSGGFKNELSFYPNYKESQFLIIYGGNLLKDLDFLIDKEDFSHSDKFHLDEIEEEREKSRRVFKLVFDKPGSIKRDINGLKIKLKINNVVVARSSNSFGINRVSFPLRPISFAADRLALSATTITSSRDSLCKLSEGNWLVTRINKSDYVFYLNAEGLDNYGEQKIRIKARVFDENDNLLNTIEKDLETFYSEENKYVKLWNLRNDNEFRDYIKRDYKILFEFSHSDESDYLLRDYKSTYKKLNFTLVISSKTIGKLYYSVQLPPALLVYNIGKRINDPQQNDKSENEILQTDESLEEDQDSHLQIAYINVGFGFKLRLWNSIHRLSDTYIGIYFTGFNLVGPQSKKSDDSQTDDSGTEISNTFFSFSPREILPIIALEFSLPKIKEAVKIPVLLGFGFRGRKTFDDGVVRPPRFFAFIGFGVQLQ